MVLLPRRAAQSHPLVSLAQAGRRQTPGVPPSPGHPHGPRSVSGVEGRGAREGAPGCGDRELWAGPEWRLCSVLLACTSGAPAGVGERVLQAWLAPRRAQPLSRRSGSTLTPGTVPHWVPQGPLDLVHHLLSPPLPSSHPKRSVS